MAERNPGRQAFGYLADTLSYGELAERSNRLARLLIEEGVRKGDRVGIFMEKRIDTATAVYGIMKAGAAYVPIDPSVPQARFQMLVNDCGMRHLVSAPQKQRQLASLSSSATAIKCVVGLDSDDDVAFRTLSWSAIDDQSSAPPAIGSVSIDDLAYIIYTSGSTGQPKGIMHSHSSGASFANWAALEYGLRSGDRVANHAPLHFDLSIFDLFATAAVGATSILIPEEYTKLPASYSELLQEQKISVLFTVPFALVQLLQRGALEKRDLTKLRWIIFGGEPFPTKHLRELMLRLPATRFDNMYGPAEINGCTHYTIPAPNSLGSSVPIGALADIADALVLDDADRPVGIGESGELLVATPTMMQGYWGRPDLDRAAFWRADGASDIVYYRTGDLVRVDADGCFHFLGRKDRQVKVRGYRVELDETEAAITSHVAVEEAAAFMMPDGEGSNSICCVATLKADSRATPDELKACARRLLPWYAVPTSIEIKAVFPRTTTGKIDRRQLREDALRSPA